VELRTSDWKAIEQGTRDREGVLIGGDEDSEHESNVVEQAAWIAMRVRSQMSAYNSVSSEHRNYRLHVN
jgi:hypothetical protein